MKKIRIVLLVCTFAFAANIAFAQGVTEYPLPPIVAKRTTVDPTARTLPIEIKVLLIIMDVYRDLRSI